MNSASKRGFTLLELLVVLVIMGLLASIVFTFIARARQSGGDAGVKSNLNTVRTQMELYHTLNGSFGSAAFVAATCPAYNAGGTNAFASDKKVNDAIAQATLNGGGINRCESTTSTWAVAVGLKTDTAASWCIDSRNVGRRVNLTPTAAISGAQCN